MRTNICNWISILLLFGEPTVAWIPYKLVPFRPPIQVDKINNHQIKHAVVVPSNTVRSDEVRRIKNRNNHHVGHLHLSNDSDPSRQPSEDDNIGFSTDCDNDEECEIDWDAMPDSTSETTEEIATYSSAATVTNTITTNERIFYDDFGFDEVELDRVEETEEKRKHVLVPEMTSTKPAAAKATIAATTIPENLRTRLEMQWQMTEQIEDCDVYKPVSCGGEQCTACNGSGVCQCRFCRGTGYIYLQLPSAAKAPITRAEQIQLQQEEQMFGGNLNSLLQKQPSSYFVNCNICQQKGHETCKVCQGSGWVAGWTNVSTS